MTRLHSDRDKVVGLKQSRKAVQEGKALCLYYAKDAEARVLEPMLQLCHQMRVETVCVETMHQLGQAVGIEVGAAVVTVLQ